MKAEPVALDTGAFALHFENNSQVREIINAILSKSLEAHTCELNLAEHYYKTCEKKGRDIAEITNAAIRRISINIHVPDEPLSIDAGRLKCKHRGKLSIVDSYILAVSKRYNCRLITTDSVLKEINLVPTTLLKIP